MTAVAHEEPNYMAIFWWLAVLTILEVAVTYLPIGQVVVGSSLVAMALGKAALVAMFFMHLKFERTTLGLIALTPLILCVFLLFMLLPDSDPALKASPETVAAAAAGEH